MEGFIRGYAEVEFKGGRRELEIELKYHEGRPVIRELKRISTPGRRVYASVRDLKPHRSGLGSFDRLDAAGRDDRYERAREERGRRSHLPRVLTGKEWS